MSTQSHCELLVERFRANGLEASIALQLASPPESGVLVWPYAVDADPSRRNEDLPRRSPTGELLRRPPPGQRTLVLVLPSDLPAYDEARRLVANSPVLGTGERHVRLAIDDVPLADRAALFSASGIPYRLALALTVQGADATTDVS